MYHTMGLTKAQVDKLCEMIEARGVKPGMRRWPPILGLRNALAVTLKYLRRNRVQEEISEDYDRGVLVEREGSLLASFTVIELPGSASVCLITVGAPA